jgi:ribosomal protein S12
MLRNAKKKKQEQLTLEGQPLASMICINVQTYEPLEEGHGMHMAFLGVYM